MCKSAFVCAALLASSLLAEPALAANGSTSQGVNMHAGPKGDFPEVMRLAPDLNVTIHGCSRAWDWCDVEWRGNRGWVLASALDYRLDRTLMPVASVGPRAELPEIEFDLAAYWDEHYRQRPWYPERHRWSAWSEIAPDLVAEVVN